MPPPSVDFSSGFRATKGHSVSRNRHALFNRDLLHTNTLLPPSLVLTNASLFNLFSLPSAFHPGEQRYSIHLTPVRDKSPADNPSPSLHSAISFDDDRSFARDFIYGIPSRAARWISGEKRKCGWITWVSAIGFWVIWHANGKTHVKAVKGEIRCEGNKK